MKIAMISPILAATPPRATGPQEQDVSVLTEALVARGHDVTLYATGDSRTRGKLKYLREQGFDALLPGIPKWADVLYNHALLEHTSWAFADAARSGADVVHTHRPVGLLCHRAFGLPHVNSLHHGFSEGNLAARPYNDTYFGFFDQFPEVEIVAVSRAQAEAYSPELGIRVIHLAVDYPKFAVGPANARDYLLFMGRIVPAKGVHIAIEVALATGLRLKIAGALDSVHSDLAYFRRHVEPRIDGDRIQYVGEATSESKIGLLGGALAFVCPIQWDEPLAVSMLEAMACGTPVVAFRRGCAAEVIDEGVTGHVCDDFATMVARVRALATGTFDPAAVRRHGETRYSVERYASAHEEAYRAAIARHARARGKTPDYELG